MAQVLFLHFLNLRTHVVFVTSALHNPVVRSIHIVSIIHIHHIRWKMPNSTVLLVSPFLDDELTQSPSLTETLERHKTLA